VHELLESWLCLAERLRVLWRDADAGERALERVRELSAPPRVAARLRSVYDGT